MFYITPIPNLKSFQITVPVGKSLPCNVNTFNFATNPLFM
jgi:hypothetical protein